MGPLWSGLALALLIATLTAAEKPCRFPASWLGQWYLKESIFNITENVLGSKGKCVERRRNKYLIQDSAAGSSCFVCVVMFERHRNIVEFKESQQICTERPSHTHVCQRFLGDAPLNTMVRVRAEPVPCPFRGAFTFDYRRSDKVCDSPISRVSACSDPWRLVLHHQACPDVAGAERISERLTCLATWRSFDEQFMFGRLDSVKTKTDADRYRCFIYKHFGGGRGGYHVVQSGDTTCQGLQDVHEGHKVMNFYHEKRRLEKCQLPAWLTEHHEWYRLDSRLRYHVFHKNHSIKVSHQSWSGQPPAAERPTKLVCNHLAELGPHRARVVFHHSHDCTSGYQCAMLYRRDKHVVEFKMGEVMHSVDAACRYFDESRYNFTTLVSATHGRRPCPYLGRHAVIGVRREGRVVRDACAGGFSTLVMGCSSSDTLELRSECPQRQQPTQYRCHGNWEENGTHYLVASPLSHSVPSVRRVCFISSQAEAGVRFSTLHETCRRRAPPGSELLAFNVTINGNCRAEASTSSCVRAHLSTLALVSLMTALWLAVAPR